MLDTVSEVFRKPIRGVFGGSHLVEADREHILATRAFLHRSGAEIIALGHCTGAAAYALLAEALPALRPLSSGACFELA